MNLDTRIEASFKAAIDAEPSNTPSPLADVKETALSRRRRERLVAWTVSGLALLAVVFTLTIQAGVEPSDVAEGDVYVADGEVLLATDPFVVVQGAPSPEPRFDTSGLGTDRSLTPIADASTAVAVVEPDLEFATDGEVIRVTTVGTTVAGREAVILHAYQTPTDGERLQVRCLVVDQSSTACGGYRLHEVADEPGGLGIPESPDEPSTYTVGGAAPLWWDVPTGTSVVVLTVNGESVWQRPIAGAAVFDTVLYDGDLFMLTALDDNGTEIRIVEMTAHSQ